MSKKYINQKKTLVYNDKTLNGTKISKRASLKIPFIEMHTAQFMMLIQIVF